MKFWFGGDFDEGRLPSDILPPDDGALRRHNLTIRLTVVLTGVAVLYGWSRRLNAGVRCSSSQVCSAKNRMSEINHFTSKYE